MKAKLVGLAALLVLAACGSSNNTPPIVDAGTDAGVDAGTDAGTDAGADAGDGSTLTPAGCYINPQNNLEILNACTDAGFVDKAPVLPHLQADGGLPPLP